MTDQYKILPKCFFSSDYELEAYLKVNTVDRECADGQGNMVVLNHDMFKCENCGDKDNEYKNIKRFCAKCCIK